MVSEGELAPPQCMTILTSAGGVTKAVQPLLPVWQREVLASVGATVGCYLRWRAGMLSRTSSQFELVNVPVEGWIIDPNVHGLLYGPCDVVHLPSYYGEVVHIDVMTSDVGMVINMERGPKVFLEHFLRGPCRSPIYS